jgi:PmbA protein
MVLENRAARQILGVLGGALSGNALHHQRSCLAGKLGERIGSDLLTIVDDPTVPRGLASRPWDGDGLVAERRPIVLNGVLQQYYLGVYYARKLGMPVTTGGRSNWILPVGTRSWQEIAAEHKKVIFVNGFLGGNNNAATGDFSFGIQGVLLEDGAPTRPVSEMNVSGNTLTIFHQLVEAANDPWTFSSVITPSLVFTDVQFSGV